MSVSRYISISLLIVTLLSQSNSLSVLALSDEGIEVNSLSALSAPAEYIDQEIASNTSRATIIDINPELKLDIQSLLEANKEYAKNQNTSIEESTKYSSSIFSPGAQFMAIDSGTLFEDFLIPSETRILDGTKSTKIKLDRRARTEKKVASTRGTIVVNMATGTIITTPIGTIIDPTSIGIYTANPVEKQKANAYHKNRTKGVKDKKGVIQKNADSDVFEFGIPGTHLIFSAPVMISIHTPAMTDGNEVDIAVLHAGNNGFNISGLSVTSDTLCSTTGTASKPGSVTTVKNGKVTFYTCGASSFTMNPTGGGTGSNDLRIIVGDCSQVQVYYNNLTQVFSGNPPATGCATTGNMDAWPVLRVGTTSYGNDFTAWASSTTTGTTLGNTYTATSTMTTPLIGGRTYQLIIDWSHTAPNKYFTWSWRVIVPTGNPLPIKFYYGMDSAVAGGDPNDVGYFSSTGGTTVGIFDNTANVLSAFRYLSGTTWTAYQANAWNTVRTQIANGVNFTNNIQLTGGDLGFGVNWDLGTPAATTLSGTVEWRLAPYVAGNISDLIPGIGQPEGPLVRGYISQMPITVSNIGNISSTGVHTAVLTLPANISGPTSAFVDNGWSCGVTIGVTVTCTKTMGLAPLADDIFRIPVVPLPAAPGTVTFSVTISNPGDAPTPNNTAISTNSVATASLVNAPGGVAGATFWVKGNGTKNCIATGCTITTWTNSGSLGAAANAVTGLGTVTYDPVGTINFNPTIYFNNASLNTNSNLSITTAQVSIFTATRIGAGGSFLMGPQTVVANSLDWSTSPTLDRLTLYPATNIYNGANLRTVNKPNITSTSRAAGGTATNRTDGFQTLTSAAIVTAFVGTNRGIGRSNTTNSTLANVGEVIIYPTEIIGINRDKIETYLAIKYGITLNQTTLQNYILSNTGTAWDATLAGAYNRDIAGIARDDISGLSQVRSQSVNNTGDIIVSTTTASIGSNIRSFIWANDATATGAFSTTDAPVGFERITREWQFQEKNGDVSSIKIAYPVSSVPIGFSGTLMMLIDNNGVFATGATAYTGILNSGNWEFTLNITDMSYMTFAKSVPTDTIPPVINSISLSSGSLLPIGNFPLTVTYSDTGSIINAGSFTGRIYSWDATGSVWNTTNLAPSYMTLSGVATTLTGRLTLSGLPFGKYKFDISVADTVGNIQTQSYVYYIDAIEWTASSDSYDIGTLAAGVQSFGTGEMTLTVRTVGAAFTLNTVSTSTLTRSTESINYWNGTFGWGYDQWDGSAFTGLITTTGTPGTLATQAALINTNGLKNIYTYRIKFGSRVSAEQVAGAYSGTMRMNLIVSY